jgi:hypothetical protein
MKQVLILVVSAIVFTCYSTILFSQSDFTKTDTVKQHFILADSLAYMKEIVANKQKYINQPLSVLLNDFKIPVKSFSIDHDKLRSLGIWIYFDNSYNIKEGKWNNWDEDPVSIIVEWTKPILRSDMEAYLHKGAGEWTAAEQKYFMNEIISDIVLPFRKQN